jgi:predicted acyl esterase
MQGIAGGGIVRVTLKGAGVAVLLAAALSSVAGVQGKQTFLVPMRDGVRLATDVYLPADGKPAPVILMRTPYNKDHYRNVGRGRAAAGYAFVVQDTRGRFASQGGNLPFEGDGWWGNQDGYDTLEWIAAQPWCNGKIGMHGGSAMGIAQFLAAATGTRRLTALNIAVATPDLYSFAYANGLFRKALVAGWLQDEAFDPGALAIWMSHPTYDTYWQERSAARRYGRVDVPARHSGGWYDIFAQGTIDGFVGLQERGGAHARGAQRLVMGPGIDHVSYPDLASKWPFPNADKPPAGAGDVWDWLDLRLKGLTSDAADLAPVTYYVMGDVTDAQAPGNCWRSADAWPPFATRATALYLHADRSLGFDNDEKGAGLSYDYDPHRPVPTIGGCQYNLPAGPRDQRPIESRPDVLVFTTAPLEYPLEVTGRVRMKLWASTDAPDTDFIARLCDVYPDGRSINICEGGTRVRLRDSLSKELAVEPGRPYLLNLDLCSTSIIFNAGHRIRLHVTSSSYPGYAANANSGTGYPRFVGPRVAHNTVYTDPAHASHVLLPVRK